MARKGTAIFTFKILIFPGLVGGLQAAAEPCKKQTMWNIKLFLSRTIFYNETNFNKLYSLSIGNLVSYVSSLCYAFGSK